MEIMKRTVEEIYGYKATDGTFFTTEEECRKYEESAKMASYKAFEKIAPKSYDGSAIHDMFCICYEDDVRIIDFKDTNTLQIVNTYLQTKNKHCDIVSPNYIGKKCAVVFANYDDEHYVIGTREEMEKEFSDVMDRWFGKREETETAPVYDQNDKWFGIVRWCEDDIVDALVSRGIDTTKENVGRVRDELNHHFFKDRMIEAGWQFIDHVLYNEFEK